MYIHTDTYMNMKSSNIESTCFHVFTKEPNSIPKFNQFWVLGCFFFYLKEKIFYGKVLKSSSLSQLLINAVSLLQCK